MPSFRTMRWSYRDRTHAGEVLARLLSEVKFTGTPLVLAIPNGGVAVAAPVAAALSAELDFIIVRKIQIPFNTEAGFGAVTSRGHVLMNEELVGHLHLTEDQIDEAIKRTKTQISERSQAYSGLGGTSDPHNRHVIIVDDGLASGFTMMAAIRSVRESGPIAVTVAVPTASISAAERVRPLVELFLCPRIETGWSFAVAEAYEDWYDVPDSEVIRILERTTVSHLKHHARK